MQENHPGFSGVAKHALLLGSGGYVKQNAAVPAQSGETTLQSDATQKSIKPKSPCLAPRA